MEELEQLYFNYHKKNAEINSKINQLHSLKIDTFVLNKEAEKIVDDLKQLKKDLYAVEVQIKAMEENKENNGEED